MDSRRTFNELFLRAVANEYMIDYKKLKMAVSEAFTREEQEDIDPDGVHLHSTQDFDLFLKEHEIKEVYIGTVLLYLKGVKRAVSHQELVNDLAKTKDEIERQNMKSNFVRFALGLTAIALYGIAKLL